MTGKERYKRTFDAAVFSGMEHWEEKEIIGRARKTLWSGFRSKAVAAIAVVVLACGSTGVAYAADIGGIRGIFHGWFRGNEVQMNVSTQDDGTYEISMRGVEDNVNIYMSIADDNGNPKVMSEEELEKMLDHPDFGIEADGRVLLYYREKVMDVTDYVEDSALKYAYDDQGNTVYAVLHISGGSAFEITYNYNVSEEEAGDYLMIK